MVAIRITNHAYSGTSESSNNYKCNNLASSGVYCGVLRVLVQAYIWYWQKKRKLP